MTNSAIVERQKKYPDQDHVTATKNIDKNVHVLEKFLIHRVCFCPGKPETTHKFLYTPKALAVFPTSHRYIYQT